MSNSKLGTEIEGGKDFSVDVQRLIETRLLVQANSGGGKSYAIRKLLESTYGKALHIVLDMEGEFATLREKYDYILAGNDGDIRASVETAPMLAHKCLEMNFSLIVDLYELSADDRKEYVKEFCEALVNAPRSLWHPTIVVIDEAHVFAPEAGKCVSTGAVIDLLTRGRKRGFSTVLATQRIAKLHKDAAAECLNKLIGRTGLDIDLKRAGDELGMTPKDSLTLRDLEPGQFYAFGPALTRRVTAIEIGQVHSRHPKAGQRLKDIKPVATEKVRGVLSKLEDLPKQAAEEAKDKESLLKRVKELERELRMATAKATTPSLSDEELEKLKNALRKEYEKKFAETGGIIKFKVAEIFKENFGAFDGVQTPRITAPSLIRSTTPKPAPRKAVENAGDKTVGKCGREILKFLVMQPDRWFTKSQVGAMSGYAHSSGSFNNSISSLKNLGLIQVSNGSLAIADENAVREIVGDETIDTQAALEQWLGKLGKCPRVIYERLLADPDREFTKDELGEETGYAASSGSFNNAISSLSTLGLAMRGSDGTVALNPEIARL